MNQIAIVDYGMGNLQSVSNALRHVGAEPTVTSDPAALASAPGIVLPGVGAFGDAMHEMAARGVLDVVRERALEAIVGGRPFLGICLGMQVLVDSSSEAPGIAGLGVFRGSCQRIPGGEGLKVPHMGWNELTLFRQRTDTPFIGELPERPTVYFVHSYHVVPDDRALVLATTPYGIEVVAALHRGNLVATQFHPEKSQRVGLSLLTGFLRMVSESPARQAT